MELVPESTKSIVFVNPPGASFDAPTGANALVNGWAAEIGDARPTQKIVATDARDFRALSERVGESVARNAIFICSGFAPTENRTPGSTVLVNLVYSPNYVRDEPSQEVVRGGSWPQLAERLRHADGLLTVSKTTQDDWRSELRSSNSPAIERFDVVYPFADPIFSARDPRPQLLRPHGVLYSGRFVPSKGSETVVALAKKLPKLQFTVVVHNGVAKENPDGVKQLKRLNNVAILGNAADTAEIATRYRKAKCVIIPTPMETGETFGMVSIEAQHAGTRVIASPSGGLRETQLGLAKFEKPTNLQMFALAVQKAYDGDAPPQTVMTVVRSRFTRAASTKALLAAVAGDVS